MVAPLLVAGAIALGIAAVVAAARVISQLVAARDDANKNFPACPVGSPSGTCPPASTKPKITTELGPEVDGVAARSPTLEANIAALKADKWTIKYGPAGKGSYADRGAKTIVIDSNQKAHPNQVVQTLAHESGHARYTPDPYVPPDGLTRDQYVQRNADRNLKDEGEATMTNAQVRQEILKDGGPDIGIAGAQSAKYDQIAKKYPDPAQRDRARNEIGQTFANGEHPSTEPSKTYNQYYSQPFEKYWDNNVAKKP
jgi:type VI secretion system secreted protein VgrG